MNIVLYRPVVSEEAKNGYLIPVLGPMRAKWFWCRVPIWLAVIMVRWA